MCGGRCDVLRRSRHFRKTFLESTLVEPQLLKHLLQSPCILQLRHLTSRGGMAHRRLQTVLDCLARRFPSPFFAEAQKTPVAVTAEIFLSRLHSKRNQPPVLLSYALSKALLANLQPNSPCACVRLLPGRQAFFHFPCWVEGPDVSDGLSGRTPALSGRSGGLTMSPVCARGC